METLSTQAEDAVWRALGDRTRRAILDLLRAGPRTTGSIAGEFPISRIAVMRHLDALARARLVTSRKRGRERWHYLNTTPLVDLDRRWTAPGSSSIARGLTQLDRRLDPGGAVDADIDIALDVPFRSPCERVFGAIVDAPGAWWGHPFLHPATRSLAIDARLGGHFTEQWADGGAVLASVTVLQPGRRLSLSGPFHLGAASALAEFVVEPAGAGASLGFSFRAFGAIDPELARQFQGGWRDLLERRLPAFVDDGERLGIDAGPSPT